MFIVLLLSLSYQLFTFFIKFYIISISNTLLYQLLTYFLNLYTILFISDPFDKSIAISFKKNKSYQIIVKLENLNNSGENGEELVINNSDIIITIELISGFSQKQVISFIIMISIIINVRLEQRLENFNINRQQSSFFLNIEVSQPH